MDSLLELIDNRINKAMANSNHVNSQIGQVIENNNGICKVKLITTGAIYTIPNFSGTDVNVGQTVHVYWRGGFLSNQTAYIGATISKGSKIIYVSGVRITGSLSNTDTTISEFNFETQLKTTVTLHINATIQSNSNGTVTFTIVADNKILTYTPKQSVVSGYNHISFELPIVLSETGSHFVSVKANGVGSIVAIEPFITGQGIIE